MSAVGATPPRCLAQPRRASLLFTGLLMVEVEAASWQLRVITGLRVCACTSPRAGGCQLLTET